MLQMFTQIIAIAFLVLSAACSVPEPERGQAPLNIVFLLVDDMATPTSALTGTRTT